MTQHERLIKLLKEVYAKTRYIPMEECREKIADYLLENDVIVQPCDTVWYIANRNTKFECVMCASIEDMPLYIVKNLDKYKYYETEEEAKKALKERKENA